MATTELIIEDRSPTVLEIPEQSTSIFSEDQYVSVVISHDSATYEGDYAPIPSINGYTLDTAGKWLRDDISIQAIPLAQVGNESGGYTVTIG